MKYNIGDLFERESATNYSKTNCIIFGMIIEIDKSKNSSITIEWYLSNRINPMSYLETDIDYMTSKANMQLRWKHHPVNI